MSKNTNPDQHLKELLLQVGAIHDQCGCRSDDPSAQAMDKDLESTPHDKNGSSDDLPTHQSRDRFRQQSKRASGRQHGIQSSARQSEDPTTMSGQMSAIYGASTNAGAWHQHALQCLEESCENSGVASNDSEMGGYSTKALQGSLCESGYEACTRLH